MPPHKSVRASPSKLRDGAGIAAADFAGTGASVDGPVTADEGCGNDGGIEPLVDAAGNNDCSGDAAKFCSAGTTGSPPTTASAPCAAAAGTGVAAAAAASITATTGPSLSIGCPPCSLESIPRSGVADSLQHVATVAV